MLGYGTANRRTNARAAASLGSRELMPRNTTPRFPSCLAASASIGASARHGAHQEPHTLTTTTFPAWSARDTGLPSIVVPDTSPGFLRSATGSEVIAPLPLTKPWSPELPTSPVEQPASAAPPSRTAVSTAWTRRTDTAQPAAPGPSETDGGLSSSSAPPAENGAARSLSGISSAAGSE